MFLTQPQEKRLLCWGRSARRSVNDKHPFWGGGEECKSTSPFMNPWSNVFWKTQNCFAVDWPSHWVQPQPVWQVNKVWEECHFAAGMCVNKVQKSPIFFVVKSVCGNFFAPISRSTPETVQFQLAINSGIAQPGRHWTPRPLNVCPLKYSLHCYFCSGSGIQQTHCMHFLYCTLSIFRQGPPRRPWQPFSPAPARNGLLRRRRRRRPHPRRHPVLPAVLCADGPGKPNRPPLLAGRRGGRDAGAQEHTLWQGGHQVHDSIHRGETEKQSQSNHLAFRLIQVEVTWLGKIFPGSKEDLTKFLKGKG